MTENKNASVDHHCNVHAQKELVSKMTRCDESHTRYDKKVECYLKATKESRENKACMYS